MKINAKTQPELAGRVKVILLDGKPVPMCYEADEEEGYTIAYMAIGVSLSEGEVIEEIEGGNLQKVKRTGKVEIILNESTDAVD